MDGDAPRLEGGLSALRSECGVLEDEASWLECALSGMNTPFSLRYSCESLLVSSRM